MLAIAGFGLIGMWDDSTKIRMRKGLPARVKMSAQIVLSLALLQIVWWQPADGGWTTAHPAWMSAWPGATASTPSSLRSPRQGP